MKLGTVIDAATFERLDRSIASLARELSRHDAALSGCEPEVIQEMFQSAARIEHFSLICRQLISDTLPPAAPTPVSDVVHHVARIAEMKMPALIMPAFDDVLILANALVASAILEQFLRNAREAVNPESGRIEIYVHHSHDSVSIGVRDDGNGLSQERLDNLFSAGSTKGEGRGLGLQIVRDLALRSGYQVNARSALGRGTEMELVFRRC